MLFWIISAVITFLFLRWLIKVPCLMKISQPHPTNHYKNLYSPVGMNVGFFMLIILISLIPILNLIGVIFGVVWFFARKDIEDLDWNEVFPNGPGKIMKFLTKPL